MDTTRKTNTAQRPTGQLVGSPVITPKLQAHSRRLRPNRKLIIGTIIAVLLVGLTLWWFCFRGQQYIMPDRYQAVHMNNGQVFFGKLQNTNGDFLTLRDPYYTPESNDSDASGDRKQLSLVKVGEEVYGPERSVSIAKSTVQYWENLRTDSKILDAIKQQ